MSNSPIIIAIDGPSASGKGTIAKRLAAHYDFAHLDTGMLYRMVGMTMMMYGHNPADAVQAEKVALAFKYETVAKLGRDPIIRGTQASSAASKVAAIPEVRAALLKFQQDFCAHPPEEKKGAVLDGRDIGTVIAPQAPVKIYITASEEVRATRRFKEMQVRGENVTYESVLANMKERDVRDANRVASPAKPADDAVILDTSNMNADEAFAEALKIAENKLGKIT